MSTSVLVHSIRANKHILQEYVIMLMLFKGTDYNSKPAVAKFCKEAYLVNNLKAKILISIDIISSKKIDIFASSKSAFIGSC